MPLPDECAPSCGGWYEAADAEPAGQPAPEGLTQPTSSFARSTAMPALAP